MLKHTCRVGGRGPGSSLSAGGRRRGRAPHRCEAFLRRWVTCHSPAAFDLSERFLYELNIPAARPRLSETLKGKASAGGQLAFQRLAHRNDARLPAVCVLLTCGMVLQTRIHNNSAARRPEKDSLIFTKQGIIIAQMLLFHSEGDLMD